MNFRTQRSERRDQTTDMFPTSAKGGFYNLSLLLLLLILLVTLNSSLLTAASAATWGGVDESIVEKYAEEHGRAPREPFINTDQGDLLLFMFLLGGIISGFAAGYYWRTLTEAGPRKSSCCNGKENNSVSV